MTMNETLTMDTTTEDLDGIARRAQEAFAFSARTTEDQRGRWLEAIADALDAATAELVRTAMEETHLPEQRLVGEVARTTSQLRLFAAVVREGSYLEATIDHAAPPQPDLRRMLRPIGPVAVFSASNFPFAFSVAGGDTASALAVGCPVIVKAHPAHARLSRRTAEIVAEALRSVDAPQGLFAMVEGYDAGIELVKHPDIAAVAFTGSVAGGRSLSDLVSARPVPIPFFGELGSINPVVVSEAADAARGADLAQGLVGSFTLGTGQFCTKPGVSGRRPPGCSRTRSPPDSSRGSPGCSRCPASNTSRGPPLRPRTACSPWS
jgi:NADP-dependent aldehyde dehydrogenase